MARLMRIGWMVYCRATAFGSIWTHLDLSQALLFRCTRCIVKCHDRFRGDGVVADSDFHFVSLAPCFFAGEGIAIAPFSVWALSRSHLRHTRYLVPILLLSVIFVELTVTRLPAVPLQVWGYVFSVVAGAILTPQLHDKSIPFDWLDNSTHLHPFQNKKRLITLANPDLCSVSFIFRSRRFFPFPIFCGCC